MSSTASINHPESGAELHHRIARAVRSWLTGAARRCAWSLTLAGGLCAAQSTWPVDHGLVAVGRIPADTFDAGGPGRDSLGGISAIAIDESNVRREGDVLRGRLYALPDRGFADGGTDYRPRVLVFDFTLHPRKGAKATTRDGLRLTNTSIILLTTTAGAFFTGFDADDATWHDEPRTTPTSVGAGRRSLDPEGLVLMPGGGFIISDEYGPLVLRFDKAGALSDTLFPRPGQRHASLPLAADTLTPAFSSSAHLVSGRRSNRGLEGLTRSPDGNRLVGILQGPLVQDGGQRATAANTRILVWDNSRSSPTHGALIAEYVHELAVVPGLDRPRRAGISEILAISNTQLLILERDNLGPGSNSADSMQYKRINIIDAMHATNLLATGFSLPVDAPGHMALPETGLPESITPVASAEFIDLLDERQLASFGLNANAPGAYNRNTLTQKWEGLALAHARDPLAPDDWFLFVCNDNDFKAHRIVHNGQYVGQSDTPLDTIFLVYRVTLPRVTHHSR